MKKLLTIVLSIICFSASAQIGLKINGGVIGQDVDSYRGYAEVDLSMKVSCDRHFSIMETEIRLEVGGRYGYSYYQETTGDNVIDNVFEDYASFYIRGLCEAGPDSKFMVGPTMEYEFLNERFIAGVVGLFRLSNLVQIFFEPHMRLERNNIIDGGGRLGINIAILDR